VIAVMSSVRSMYLKGRLDILAGFAAAFLVRSVAHWGILSTVCLLPACLPACPSVCLSCLPACRGCMAGDFTTLRTWGGVGLNEAVRAWWLGCAGHGCGENRA
jgi:hypothetical protein